MYFRRLIHTQKAHINTVLNLQVDAGEKRFQKCSKSYELFCKKTVVTKITSGLNVILCY